MSIKIAPGRRRDDAGRLHRRGPVRLSPRHARAPEPAGDRGARRAAAAGDLPARARGRPARRKDPYAALREDGGIRSLLAVERRLLPQRHLRGDRQPRRRGRRAQLRVRRRQAARPNRRTSAPSSIATPFALLRAVYLRPHLRDRASRCCSASSSSASIRIGISTILVKSELRKAFKTALQSVVLALILSTVVAMLLAQWMLRADPRHPERPDAARPRRARRAARPAGGAEFKDLGSSFDAVSAQLSESRAKALVAADRLRVGRRQPRGRGRALRSRRAS